MYHNADIRRHARESLRAERAHEEKRERGIRRGRWHNYIVALRKALRVVI